MGHDEVLGDARRREQGLVRTQAKGGDRRQAEARRVDIDVSQVEEAPGVGVRRVGQAQRVAGGAQVGSRDAPVEGGSPLAGEGHRAHAHPVDLRVDGMGSGRHRTHPDPHGYHGAGIDVELRQVEGSRRRIVDAGPRLAGHDVVPDPRIGAEGRPRRVVAVAFDPHAARGNGSIELGEVHALPHRARPPVHDEDVGGGVGRGQAGIEEADRFGCP